MATRSIHENIHHLNSQQINQLLSILSKIDSILALTQNNLFSQPKTVIHDSLWVASDLILEAQQMCKSAFEH